MENQDFPEELLPPDTTPTGDEPQTGPVDFSDLGPLFQEEPQDELPAEQEDEDEDLDLSQIPGLAEFKEAQEDAEDELDLEKLNALLSDSEAEPEAPVYQASDYPDADQAQEEGTVLPGEAAWLLRKLRELPPDPENPYEEPEAAEEDQEPEAYEEELQPELPEQPQQEPELPEETVSPLPPVPEAEPEVEPEAEPEQPQQEQPQEEAPAEKAPVTRRSPRKGRPRRKKGEGFFGIPNLVVTAVWIAITLFIGVTLGRMIWVCAADVLAFGREDKPVTITIYESDTIDDITEKLHNAELIHYPGLFKLYASFAVDEGEIHPGIWDLNTRYDYHALVNMMSPSSSREVIELMIPEGYSSRQIFALMEEKKICTALDLGSYAAAGELDDFWFLEGVERGDLNCLEGFLFPDTYQFYKNDSPRNVLQKMLRNFETKFDQNLIAQIGTLNDTLAVLMKKGGHSDDYIAAHQFNVRDVIIVASLIEKETSSAEEGYTIASVIYNRLYNWGDHPPLLNIDASIVYALGGKTDLTQEDLKVDSPYNTYLHTGLTPGPIANPGLASIQAALAPADTDFYFYVLDPAQGSHRFTSTYEEHQAARAAVGG